jgi:hypothetical protein
MQPTCSAGCGCAVLLVDCQLDCARSFSFSTSVATIENALTLAGETGKTGETSGE